MGGCPILTYELYMSTDGGTTYTIVDELWIKNKPFLTSHTISDLSNQGATYNFKLKVYNEVGSSESLARGIVLAVLPSKPQNPPTQDYAYTT